MLPTSRNELILAAAAASFVFAGPALASTGLVCSGNGASASIAMGRLAVMSVLGANVEIGDITYSTGAERGPGEPFVVGQDFAEDGKIWIDFVDPNFERILVELRVTFGKDDTWSGTLSTPDRSVDIECTEG